MNTRVTEEGILMKTQTSKTLIDKTRGLKFTESPRWHDGSSGSWTSTTSGSTSATLRVLEVEVPGAGTP